MNQVYARILEQGQPSRADIAELLASLGKPGENREAKEIMVRQLYDELGHSGTNWQGHHIVETLDSYREY